MPYGIPVRWSARERPVVDAAIRELLAGEHATAMDAAKACFAQLARLRRDAPDAQPPQSPRSLRAVYNYIMNQTREKRRYGQNTTWTRAEHRVMRRYVQGLLDGRFSSTAAATRACIREFERQRTAGRSADWSRVPRTETAVWNRIHKYALKAGRARERMRYSKAELDMIDRYARAVADGRYQDLTPAVILCRRDLARMRERSGGPAHLPRPFKTVHDRISRRARAHGWAWSAEAWRPDELRIIDRYIRDVAAGARPSVSRAAKDCLVELEALDKRPGKPDSALATAYRQRTLSAIRKCLRRWVTHREVRDAVVDQLARRPRARRRSICPVKPSASCR